MELGLGSYAFRWAVGADAFRPATPMTLHGMVSETAALGCTLLQIADSAELDRLDAPGRRELLRHAGDVGVRLQVGTSGCTTERLLAQLEAAVDLQADVVRIVLDHGDINPTQQEVESTLAVVAPRYEDAGVTVAIENHFLTPSTEIEAIVTAVGSPAVGVCLDTANSIMVGEWPNETIDLLAPYAVNLHLKDYAVEPDPLGVGGHVVGRRLGDGWFDVPALLDVLVAADQRRGGRLGVIIEQWLPLAADEGSTLRAESAGRAANVERARAMLARHASSIPSEESDHGQS